MDKYICTVCGYVYDPELGDPDAGVKPGTSFDDLPKIGYVRSVVLQKTFEKE